MSDELEIINGRPGALWAVTSGEYSDYGVNALFDTEEDARAAAVRGFGDAVTQIDYYPSGDPPVQREVWMGQTGPITADGPTHSAIYPLVAGPTTVWRRRSMSVDRPHVEQEREGSRIWVTVQAPTKELAEKVLHDRIAKARAELLGL